MLARQASPYRSHWARNGSHYVRNHHQTRYARKKRRHQPRYARDSKQRTNRSKRKQGGNLSQAKQPKSDEKHERRTRTSATKTQRTKTRRRPTTTRKQSQEGTDPECSRPSVKRAESVGQSPGPVRAEQRGPSGEQPGLPQSG